MKYKWIFVNGDTQRQGINFINVLHRSVAKLKITSNYIIILLGKNILQKTNLNEWQVEFSHRLLIK